MGASKGRWISFIVVLVLVNYLVISSLVSLVNKRNQALSATPTRTAKPTYTPDTQALSFVTSTPSPVLPTETATPVGLSTPAELLVTPTPTATPAKYVVQANETLLDIAIRLGVSTEAILELNKLKSPDLIFAGQELLIPARPAPTATATGGTPGASATRSTATPSTPGPAPSGTPATPSPAATAVIHVVQAGDTLLALSYQYKADLREIRRVNNLQNDALYVGQKLIIPNPGTNPTPGPTPTPVTGRTHVVQSGETLSSIAQRYGVTQQALMAANGLANPNVIYAGQTLIIPGS